MHNTIKMLKIGLRVYYLPTNTQKA